MTKKNKQGKKTNEQLQKELEMYSKITSIALNAPKISLKQQKRDKLGDQEPVEKVEKKRPNRGYYREKFLKDKEKFANNYQEGKEQSKIARKGLFKKGDKQQKQKRPGKIARNRERQREASMKQKK